MVSIMPPSRPSNRFDLVDQRQHDHAYPIVRGCSVKLTRLLQCAFPQLHCRLTKCRAIGIPVTKWNIDVVREPPCRCGPVPLHPACAGAAEHWHHGRIFIRGTPAKSERPRPKGVEKAQSHTPTSSISRSRELRLPRLYDAVSDPQVGQSTANGCGCAIVRIDRKRCSPRSTLNLNNTLKRNCAVPYRICYLKMNTYR
jgi:hypothetical protein